MAFQNQSSSRSLGEIEALVAEFYGPRTERAAGISEELHRIQLSPEGWQVANDLLQSNDEKTQFFGSLTFTVKLNANSKSLSDSDAQEVLRQLISWLIRSLQRGSTPLVIQKLCSTLVVYFLHFSATWTQSVKHLVMCLYADEHVDTAAVKEAPGVPHLLSNFTPAKLSAALCFAATLADEIAKTDGNNIKQHKFHDSMKKNVQDVVELIRPGLESGNSLSSNLRKDAMKCFQSWVLYSHKAYVDAGVILQPLKSLTTSAIAWLVDEDMYEVTIDLFSDVLSNYSRFLGDDAFNLLFKLLTSQWSQDKYAQLVQGDGGFESLQYGQFLIAFGDARVDELARANDARSRQLFDALEGLLSASGHAVAEDEIFIPALEFWQTFVEVLIDSLYSDVDDDGSSSPAHGISEEKPPVSESTWFVAGREMIMRVIERCVRKIQYPPESEFSGWDTTEKAGFKEARAEVIDLLQASFTLTGMPLFTLFSDMTLHSLETKSFSELEVALFCLSGLVDSVPDDESSDVIMETILSSTLFTALTDPNSSATQRAQQATLSLIGNYDIFFEKHTEYLPQALTFLFQALTAPALAATASDSIKKLCQSCRESLTPELAAFVQQYTGLAEANIGEDASLVKERVLSGISSIIQALPEETQKLAPLISLLENIDLDFQKCLTLASVDTEATASGVLRCVLSIAKGLQVPEYVPVEIAEKNSKQVDGQFWISGAGSSLQSHIWSMIQRLMAIFPQSGDIVDISCGILRAGFTETVPGPFVFSSKSIADFVTSFDPRNPRMVTVINTACCFASSQSMKESADVEEALQRLAGWAVLVLQTLQDPSNDPETAQSLIDFFYRLLPTCPYLIFSQPGLAMEHIFLFILSAFRGKQPLPKNAAADFLASLLVLSDLSPHLQSTVQSTIQSLGPMLAESMVYNISGNAARSELDKVCDPLRKMVVRHPGSKGWLQGALFSQDFASDLVKDSEKTAFLQKIINLRGGRQTNQVVKNFWMDCKGTNFAYTS